MLFVVPSHRLLFILGLIFKCLYKIRIYLASALVSDTLFKKSGISINDLPLYV